MISTLSKGQNISFDNSGFLLDNYRLRLKLFLQFACNIQLFYWQHAPAVKGEGKGGKRVWTCRYPLHCLWASFKIWHCLPDEAQASCHVLLHWKYSHFHSLATKSSWYTCMSKMSVNSILVQSQILAWLGVWSLALVMSSQRNVGSNWGKHANIDAFDPKTES